MNKKTVFLFFLSLFILTAFSETNSESTFKLGACFDGLTIDSLLPGYQSADYLIPGDRVLGIKRITPVKQGAIREYIGMTLDITDDIPKNCLIKTNDELEFFLKQVQPEDIVLLWILREGNQLQIYIPAVYKLPNEPLIFTDLQNHTSSITKIDILEAEDLLVTASLDKTVKVFDLNTGQMIKTLYPPFRMEKDGQILSCSISPSTKDIVCSVWLDVFKEDAVFYVFDYETATIKHTVKIPNISHHMQFSRDGKYLVVSLSLGHGIHLYDGRTFELLDHTNFNWDATSYWCDINLDGNRIITGSQSGGLYLYGIEDNKLVLMKHEERYCGDVIYNTIFSNDGEKIAVSFIDEIRNRIEVLSSETLKRLYNLNTSGIRENLFSLTWTENDLELVASGEGIDGKNKLYIWNKAGRGKRDEVPLNIEWVDHIRAYGDKICYSSYDPEWGIIADGMVVFQKKSINTQVIAESLQIDTNGTRLKFKIEDQDEAFIFDILKRQLVSEKDYLETFDYFPPITSTLNITNWKDSTNFKMDGEYFPMKQFEKSKVIAITADRKGILSGTDWNLRYYDSQKNIIWENTAPSITYYVNLIRGGFQCFAFFADGTFRWYRTCDGENLLNFFIDPQTLEWILWTQNGYYACSRNADRMLKWRINTDDRSASEIYDFSQYSERFHNTVITMQTILENKTDVELLYEGNKPFRQISDFEIPPEIAEINEKEISEDAVQLMITCKVGNIPEGILPVISLNGKKQLASGFHKEGNHFFIPIELVSGQNIISVQLQNREGILSKPKIICVEGNKREFLHRNFYLIAIGINDYEKYQNLNYCIKDAEETTRLFDEKRKNMDKTFSAFIFRDEDLNKSNLFALINKLKIEIAREDIFVFYYSGHGIASESKTGYDFSLVQTNGMLFPFKMIIEKLEELSSQNMLIMIDACQSGVLTDIITAGIIEDEMFRINRDTGINVFSSSQARENSIEIEILQNGLFTEALLNSFYSEDDKWISVRELAENIQIETEKICVQNGIATEYPKILTTGYDFVVAEE